MRWPARACRRPSPAATPASTAALVAVALALAGDDYRAVEAGPRAARVAAVILSFVMHPFRPRLGLTEFRGLFHFSKWMLVRSVLQDLGSHASTLIIGRTLNV